MTSDQPTHADPLTDEELDPRVPEAGGGTVSQSTPQGRIGNALTDGTGISAITGSKFVKDFVADFLMTAAAALAAVNILSVDSAAAQPAVVATAVLGALIRVGYRAILKWATT